MCVILCNCFVFCFVYNECVLKIFSIHKHLYPYLNCVSMLQALWIWQLLCLRGVQGTISIPSCRVPHLCAVPHYPSLLHSTPLHTRCLYCWTHQSTVSLSPSACRLKVGECQHQQLHNPHTPLEGKLPHSSLICKKHWMLGSFLINNMMQVKFLAFSW